MDLDMAKEDRLTLEAVVLGLQPDGTVHVVIGEHHDVLAEVSAKFRKRHIRLEAGLRVQVELSPDNMNKGRLV